VSHSDAELADLDLAALLAGGIAGPDGRLRDELQGIGSAAAAVQLDDQLVTAAQVGEAGAALRGHPASGIAPPALDHVVRLGLAACRDAADREALGRWLGMVAGLLVVRERARASR
jgi:hypothetical protein